MRETYDTNALLPLLYPVCKTVELLVCREVLTAKFVPLATFLSLQITLFFFRVRCCLCKAMSNTPFLSHHKMSQPQVVLYDSTRACGCRSVSATANVVHIVSTITVTHSGCWKKIIPREMWSLPQNYNFRSPVAAPCQNNCAVHHAMSLLSGNTPIADVYWWWPYFHLYWVQ